METWKVLSYVQEGPSKPLEWIVGLERSSIYENSFEVFVWKMQIGSLNSCAAFSLLGLGFSSHMYEEWIRSKTKPKIHLNQCFHIWFFKHLFSIFFIPFWCQSLPIILNLSLLNSARNIEWILCTKRFEKYDLVFFS